MAAPLSVNISLLSFDDKRSNLTKNWWIIKYRIEI